jgi:hypothetical protein
MRGPSAEIENSIAIVARFRMAPRRREAPARALALAPLLAGAALLVAAEPMTLRSVHVGGRVIDAVTAGAHHGWALAVVGAALAVLGVIGALVGSRAAGISALVLSAIALWIVLVVDRPALDDAGLVGGRLGRASAGSAWRVELVGAIVAVVGAIGVVVVSAVGERRH